MSPGDLPVCIRRLLFTQYPCWGESGRDKKQVKERNQIRVVPLTNIDMLCNILFNINVFLLECMPAVNEITPDSEQAAGSLFSVSSETESFLSGDATLG